METKIPQTKQEAFAQLDEMLSEKVDDPKTFRAKKHIRGVRLHFLPESYEGTQALYDGITFERDKSSE